MALPISSMYNDVVKGPHETATRVRVFHDGVEVTPDGGVPVVDGSVSATLSGRVTRSLDLQVPFEYFPHNPDDLFSPYQAVVLIESGPKYLDGTVEYFPIFTGRVYEASLGGDGSVRLRGDDLAADVLAYRFEQPRNSQTNSSIMQQIQALIADAIPNATFGFNDVVDTMCPALTWDEDRGQALDELAAAMGARWYTLGDGRFVVNEYPYELGEIDVFLIDGTVIPIDSGISDGQGIIVSATKTITRDATANSITVVSERTDGTAPVVARRRDAGTTSPTRFGGPFGKVSQILKPKTPLTATQADTLARKQLQASLALTEQWSVSCTPLHFVEPGDTIRIRYRGVETVQIVDSWQLPLATSGTMTINTRAALNPLETETS